jgi:hypothetical protein
MKMEILSSLRTDSQDILQYRQMKVVRLSALSTVCFYPPGDTPGTQLCDRLSRPHSAAGRIKSIKNLNYPFGNQTRELRACSEVPHPTASPCAPSSWIKGTNYEEQKLGNVSHQCCIVTKALRPFATLGTSSASHQYSIQKTQTSSTTALRISELLVYSREWVHAAFRC